MTLPAREDAAISTAPNARSRLFALLGDRRSSIVGLIISSILAGFAEAGILAILAQIGASLAGKSDHVHRKIGPFALHVPVGKLFTVAIALAIFRIVLQIPLSYLPARIGADVQAGLRRDLFHAFSRASWAVQSRDREGHLQESMTSQTLQATGAVMQTTNLIIALFTFLTLMGSAFLLNPSAAGIVLAVALLLFATLRPLRGLGRRSARALSAAQVQYAGEVSESIRVAEETHVFGVAGTLRARIDERIDAARVYFFRTQLIARMIPSVYQSLIYLLLVAGLAIIYPSAKGHAASLGAVVLVLIRGSSSGQQVQGSYQSLQQSLAFVERVQKTTTRYALAAAPQGGRALAEIASLGFNKVCFAYRPGHQVLSDVSFEVDGGEAIGVIGPTGAGKSTLIQLLLRLRVPETGEYLVNGADAEDFADPDWHRQVAYVSQETRLLYASVADNIRFFRDIDDAAVERAARLARIHDDVLTWQDGYDTIVGPRANAVSGGQQQRLCLARALAARPGMLVLDEPTSALDPHSESLIQESLSALKDELTLFIIAHRMSTLDVCGRVMVIQDGKLVAFDTAAALKGDNAYFRTASMLAAGTAGHAGS